MSVEFSLWPENLAMQYREKDLWIDEPLTHLLAQQVKKQPNATAIICGERSFTYQQLDEYSSRFAHWVCQRGVKVGSTAVVQLPNSAELYITYFALLKAGVAAVFALFNHNKLELESYTDQLDPALFIASKDHLLFKKGDFLEELKSVNPSIVLSLIDGVDISLSAIWQDTEEEKNEPTPADQVAFFQISGGSTGVPKLIPRTHNDYYFSVRRSVEICQLSTQTRFLCCLPAAHNYCLSSPGALGVFFAGATVVVSRDTSPVNCIALINKHEVTMTALVPSALLQWLAYAKQEHCQFSTLKLIQVGGAKLDTHVAEQVSAVLGASLQQVYGMAEGLVCYTRFDDDQWHIINTQGRPMSAYDEVRVSDVNGNPLPPGNEGQLEVRGPYTMRGYYKAPEHNAKSFSEDGFYRTGDLVHLTENGYLWVVGRVKDQVNRGGEKIAAQEVETLLNKHDAIKHSAVISIPDSALGEKICAFVVMPDQQLKPVAIRKYLRSLGIADYKIPDRIISIEELPLTAVGKIDKKALRKITVS